MKQNKKIPMGIFLFCPPARIRTEDLLLKRELLYQLSYGRKLSDNIRFLESFKEKLLKGGFGFGALGARGGQKVGNAGGEIFQFRLFKF